MEEGRKVMPVQTQNDAFENRPVTTDAGRGRRDPSRNTPQSRPHSSQDGGNTWNSQPPLPRQSRHMHGNQAMVGVPITQHQIDLPKEKRLPASIPQPQRKNIASAVTRPYSAVVPRSNALRPTSAKLPPRPAPGARPGTSSALGSVVGHTHTSVGRRTKLDQPAQTKKARDSRREGEEGDPPHQPPGSPVDEEVEEDEELRDSEALDRFSQEIPPPDLPARTRSLEAGGFDFSTMDDLGGGGGGEPGGYGAAGESTLEGGSFRAGARVVDSRSGRARPKTGIAPDVYKNLVTWKGEPIDVRQLDMDTLDAQQSRARFGFRSKALELEVKLTEKLRFVADDTARFEVFQELFERTIKVDVNFSDILRVIKAAYDTRLELIPRNDADAVSLAAYTNLESRLTMAVEASQGLRDQVDKLKTEAADAAAARNLMDRQTTLTEGGEDEEEARPRHDPAVVEALQSEVDELRARLQHEEEERARMEKRLEKALQEQELRLQIPARREDTSEDESARDGPRDTARSAASGYDDHPTHRSVRPEPALPPGVRSLTVEEWTLVHDKRRLEAEEEAYLAAQDAAAAAEEEEGGGGYQYGEDYGMEYDEELEEAEMRAHYEMRLQGGYADGEYDEEREESGTDEGSEEEEGSEGEEGEDGEEGDLRHPPRPDSRLSAPGARPESRLAMDNQDEEDED